MHDGYMERPFEMLRAFNPQYFLWETIWYARRQYVMDEPIRNDLICDDYMAMVRLFKCIAVC